MRIYLVSFFLLALSAFTSNNPIEGRWETKPSEKGNVTGVVFKANYEFEGYVNKKPFVSGKYSVEGNVLSFVDNGCEGKRGKYQLIFFSNSDSLRFKAIEDDCVDRRNGMERTILGRVANPNPLLGKWETKPDEGIVTGVIFNDNDEFESYINSSPYISGNYTVKGKVLSIIDGRCGDITGAYQLNFFANSDSLRFEAIEDACEGRKSKIVNTILGRVKK